MLKWSLSAQKLAPNLLAGPLTPPVSTTTINSRLQRLKLCRTHGDITANKENIPFVNSNASTSLTDVKVNKYRLKRRHSVDSITEKPSKRYAITLPSFTEDYSPSTGLPTGQELALRGLLPDPFAFNDRYLNTSEIIFDKHPKDNGQNYIKRRKLEMEFNTLDEEKNSNLNTSNMNSAKMDDETLDELINAILDSARKEVKKKRRTGRSFNLKRRTLLKSQSAELSNHSLLSPSYTAADDPASDLSFTSYHRNLERDGKETSENSVTPSSTKIKKNFDKFVFETAEERTCKTPTAATFSRTPVTSVKLKAGSNTEITNAETDTKENYLEVGVALPSIYV